MACTKAICTWWITLVVALQHARHEPRSHRPSLARNRNQYKDTAQQSLTSDYVRISSTCVNLLVRWTCVKSMHLLSSPLFTKWYKMDILQYSIVKFYLDMLSALFSAFTFWSISSASSVPSLGIPENIQHQWAQYSPFYSVETYQGPPSDRKSVV